VRDREHGERGRRRHRSRRPGGASRAGQETTFMADALPRRKPAAPGRRACTRTRSSGWRVNGRSRSSRANQRPPRLKHEAAGPAGPRGGTRRAPARFRPARTSRKATWTIASARRSAPAASVNSVQAVRRLAMASWRRKSRRAAHRVRGACRPPGRGFVRHPSVHCHSSPPSRLGCQDPERTSIKESTAWRRPCNAPG